MNDDAPRSRTGTALAVVVLLGFALGLTTFCVREGEVAVVTTFGSPSRSLDTPGVRLRLPWPIQAVHRFDRRLQTYVSPMLSVETSDRLGLMVECFVAWRVADGRAYLQRDGSDEHTGRQLEQAIADGLRAAVADLALQDLLAPPPAEPFGGLETELASAAGAALEPYGVVVAALGVRRLALPETATKAILERMKREREFAAGELRAEGAKEAASLRAEAEEAYTTAVGQGQAKALEIRGQAERAAASSYRAFAASPDLAEFLQEAEVLDDLVGDDDTIVLDADGPVLRLLRGETP